MGTINIPENVRITMRDRAQRIIGEMTIVNHTEASYVADCTALERALCEAWAEGCFAVTHIMAHDVLPKFTIKKK